MDKTINLNEALRALRDRYQQDLPAKLAEIDAQLARVCGAKSIFKEDAQLLYRQVHGLTGSGATFGFAALSDAARVFETALKVDVQEGATGLAGDIARKLEALWAAVKAAALNPDAAKELAPATHTSGPLASHAAGNPPQPEGGGKNNRGNILLLAGEIAHAQNLRMQLGYFGYEVRLLQGRASLQNALADSAPAVIVSDMLLDAAERKNIPLVHLAASGDMQCRLAAVRSGAAAFFAGPPDVGLLVDTLDKLMPGAKSDAFKVMIVDDSLTLTSFYEATLQHAGMETLVVNDPLKALDEMVEFAPELILLDMYMPDCNGLELATIIRQQEAYAGIPIIFLSAETDVEKHLEAMKLGADGFLTKPIQAEHLVASVTARVLRYRVLRSYMVRDSLTGLLNHTKTKEELVLEVARAKRQGNALVFAMIDIDLFKDVNDRYGHPAGDRVIKSLARLLQQRLRKTDVIGRFGGEEFALILKDTNEENAAALLDVIRKAFEQVVQQAGNNKFSVTFSCGLAAYPAFPGATELNIAADMALYQAKHAGRNRLVVAGTTPAVK